MLMLNPVANVIHPIFKTLLSRPDLIAKHLGNYAELLKAEAGAIGTSLAMRAASAVVALVALLLALGLTGIAVMLGFLHGAFHWVLVIVPGVAWLLFVVGALLAKRSTLKARVDDVHDEVQADLGMLQMVKEARK